MFVSDIHNENCSMRMDRQVNPGFKLELCSLLAVLFLASHISALSFNSLVNKRENNTLFLFISVCQGGSNGMVYMKSN